MGAINLPSNLLDRIKRVEQQITDLWKSAGLSSATIAAGGLTLLNNAYLKMMGASNNEIVYIGPDGLGNQVVRIRDAAGNIVFGSVSAGGTSQRVAINPTPAGAARIEFYDDGNTTDRVSLSLVGGSFVQQRESQSDSAINGGKVSFYSDNTVFGHQSIATGNDAYIQFVDDERIYVRGRWGTGSNLSGHAALQVGTLSLGSAPGTVAWSYGATMASTMRVVGTMMSSFADHYWSLVANSNSGFTIGASGGSVNDFYFWAFRT